MSGAASVDLSEVKAFLNKLAQANKDLKQEMELWLDAVGNEFLRIVQDEIVNRKVMDSRLLLNSFEKDAANNVWKTEDEGLTLEVGTSVDYAAYVNDGHWTIDPANPNHFTMADGTLARFVPGHWEGERFLYEPGAKTGMVLKQHWVKGEPYFDSALRILDKMFPDLLERKMGEWLEKYFG